MYTGCTWTTLPRLHKHNPQLQNPRNSNHSKNHATRGNATRNPRYALTYPLGNRASYRHAALRASLSRRFIDCISKKTRTPSADGGKTRTSTRIRSLCVRDKRPLHKCMRSPFPFTYLASFFSLPHARACFARPRLLHFHSSQARVVLSRPDSTYACMNIEVPGSLDRCLAMRAGNGATVALGIIGCFAIEFSGGFVWMIAERIRRFKAKESMEDGAENSQGW